MELDTVRAWAEQITIPTYPVGSPDKNPMFLEKRVYQGSSGVVYPYPVIDRIFDEKEEPAVQRRLSGESLSQDHDPARNRRAGADGAG